jgi:DNA ligase (NAD+)
LFKKSGGVIVMNVKEQIANLRTQIKYHNEKYYEKDQPEITDYEYDQLYKELIM